MKELKDFAINLARDAGTILKQQFNSKHEIYYKGEINLVTEADKMSEDLVISACTSPDLVDTPKSFS